jgi:hypothetical protein
MDFKYHPIPIFIKTTTRLSLNELFQTIITKNQINENHIDDINQQLTTSLENMSDGFVAINEKWEYT